MFVNTISNLLNIPEDKVVFAFCLYSSLPFSFCLSHMIRNGYKLTLIHVYCIFIGIIFNFLLYHWQCLHPIILAIVSYMILLKANKSNIGIAVFVYSMVHLGCCHLIRVINSSNGHLLDISTPMMIIVQRTTLVAFSVQDDYSKDKLNNTPSILEYFSYCFFFPTVLAGPTMDHGHFKRAISGTILREFKENHNGAEPAYIKYTVKPYIISVFCAICYLSLTNAFPLNKMLNTEYLETASCVQIFIMYSCYLFGVRCMYYLTWKSSEAACNLCYMGFGGVLENGKEDWTKCINVNPINYELSTNMKVGLDNWNISTSHWLRKIVYQRIPTHPLVCTFFVSAFWHGFYVHYYYLFIFANLMILIGRIGRRNVRPYFMVSRHRKLLYDILTWGLKTFALTYHTAPFVLLNFYSSYLFWKKLYFSGHIIILLGFLVYFVPKRTV